MTEGPPKLPIVELTLTRFHRLEVWQADADYRCTSHAEVISGLAYAAALRNLRFDHAWPRVAEMRVDPSRITEATTAPTHVMLHGRVWAVPLD